MTEQAHAELPVDPEILELENAAEEIIVTPVGEILRTAREAAGMSLDEVAERFKLRRAQVAAIEASDWASLPGTTFVRGMVRSYARLLNLDPEPLLENVMPTAKAAPTEAILPRSTPRRLIVGPKTERQRREWGIGLLGLVFFGLAALIYFLLPENSEPVATVTPEPVVVSGANGEAQNPVLQEPTVGEPGARETGEKATTVAPTSENSAPNKPATAGGSGIRLTFTGPSWVEVRDASGAVIFNETGRAGIEREVSGQAPLTLHIGNAGGVTLHYKGKLVDMEPFVRNNIGRVRLD